MRNMGFVCPIHNINGKNKIWIYHWDVPLFHYQTNVND